MSWSIGPAKDDHRDFAGHHAFNGNLALHLYAGSVGNKVERRALRARTRCATRSLKLGGSTAITWCALLAVVAALAIADSATGNLWFGPAYLLVICLAAWSLGAARAICLGSACLVTTSLSNGFELHSFGTDSRSGDMLMRLAIVLLAIGLVGVTRRLYLREWHTARTDLLTGAMNRQAFFEVVSAAQPSQSWTVIAYADLDGFKQINDLFGHEAGDAALRGFATAVRRSIRKDDVFARLGGDEFVVIMEVKDQASAKIVASRLHFAMNSSFGEPTVSARCSLGALILPPMFSRGADRLRLADRLMYEAKQQGSALVAATMSDENNPEATFRHLELTARPRATVVVPIIQSVA